MIYKHFQRFLLRSYQIIGGAILCGIILILVSVGFMLVFFEFNSNWIAPTYLSPTSKDMLTFVAGYQQAEQNLAQLEVVKAQAQRDYQVAQASYQNLQRLDYQTQTYLRVLRSQTSIKTKQLKSEQQLAQQMTSTRSAVLQNQKAGLIDSADALSELAQIQQFQTSAFNDGVTWSTATLQADNGKVQLVDSLLQAKDDLQTKRQMYRAAVDSLTIAKQAMALLQNSVYMNALRNHGEDLMFVPYSNLSNIAINSPIYDCYWEIVFCRKVGVITHVYRDEDMIDFPVFNVRFSRTVRGVFVSAHMTDSKAMRDSILFTNSKPLFF